MNLSAPWFLIVLTALSGVGAEARAADEGARKVKIAWREVENAVKYDFELSRVPEMDPVIEKKEYKDLEAALQLKPGTYYFRVRGIDKADSPGPWSEVQAFAVNPAPPKLLQPDEGKVFAELLTGDGIRLKWKAGFKGSEYLFQLEDRSGSIVKRGVRGTEFAWMPQEPGEYRWRVGFETPTGEEWSKYRSFTVDKKAVPSRVTASPLMAGDVAVDMDDESEARPAEWSMIGRIAQSIVAYTVDDKDLNNNSSGAALVGLVSAELRWRGPRAAGQKWTWSGSANFEMIRQIVLGTEFLMPRGYVRGFYGQETGRWRLGPFLQVHAGESGIFIVDGSTSARKAKVGRVGGALGMVAVYRPAGGLALSALGLVRMDTGGGDAVLPNPLSSSMGFEAGFGTVFFLSPRMLLEGRLRALSESYKWQAAGAGLGTSSMSNLFLIIDVGLGYKF
jgi:hypothetical protein